MGDLGFEVGWKIDDMNSTERTFLGADAATNTETFRNIRDFRLGSDFDTQFAGTDDRAGFLAFLPTFLGYVSDLVGSSLSRYIVYLWLALVGRRFPD